MGIDAKHALCETEKPAQTDHAKNVENRAGVGDVMSDFSVTLIRPNGTAGKFTQRDVSGKVAVIQFWKDPADLAKLNALIAAYEKD